MRPPCLPVLLAIPLFLAGNCGVLAGCSDANAIGVSRVLAVDTAGGLEVGRFQYRQTLPLADKEFVLTFDDGPLSGTTDKILTSLRDACAKATFFIVGTMAAAHPELVRAAQSEGHTIGTHSYNHPETLEKLSFAEGVSQIDRGIALVTKALGQAPSPFFRFPGLGATPALSAKLFKENIGIIGVDAMAYDWALLTPDSVRQRAISELERHHGGILLLHDTKRATAAMLPQLLSELKQRGFHLVHIVPARALPAALIGPGKSD